MKTLLITLFCISTFTTIIAQITDLTGTWKIIEFEMINEKNNNKRTEEKLKEDGSVWELFIMEEGNLKQSSNMHSGVIESQEGSWKTSDNNLTFVLQIDNREIKLVYKYQIIDNILILERSNPMSTMKIISKFRKK